MLDRYLADPTLDWGNTLRAGAAPANPLGLGATDLKKPQSFNRYAYVQNDPVNMVDPSGLNKMNIGTFTVDVPINFGGEINALFWYYLFWDPSGGGPGGIDPGGVGPGGFDPAGDPTGGEMIREMLTHCSLCSWSS